MREIKQKIYKFEELNWKAKDNVREYFAEEYRDSNTQIFYEDFILELEKEGFKLLIPRYSLTYSQGDGCSVEGCIYLEEILENEKIMSNFNKDEKRRLQHICNYIEYEIEIKNGSGYYVHENTMNFEAIVWVNNYTYRDGELLENVFNKLESVLEDYFKELCSNMKDYGYEIIYGNDEVLDEYIIELEKEYFEDGTIYKY